MEEASAEEWQPLCKLPWSESVFRVRIRFRLLGRLTDCPFESRASRLGVYPSVCSLGGKLCTLRSCQRGRTSMKSLHKEEFLLSSLQIHLFLTRPFRFLYDAINHSHAGIKVSNAHKSNERRITLRQIATRDRVVMTAA